MATNCDSCGHRTNEVSCGTTDPFSGGGRGAGERRSRGRVLLGVPGPRVTAQRLGRPCPRDRGCALLQHPAAIRG